MINSCFFFNSQNEFPFMDSFLSSFFLLFVGTAFFSSSFQNNYLLFFFSCEFRIISFFFSCEFSL